MQSVSWLFLIYVLDGRVKNDARIFKNSPLFALCMLYFSPARHVDDDIRCTSHYPDIRGLSLCLQQLADETKHWSRKSDT